MKQGSNRGPFKTSHNHTVCINRAVKNAQNLCEQNGLRFTAIRKRVLELVWSNHKPVAAYDLLKQLRREKENAEPPTVYRALDFLLDNNLVHRIESLNAFVGCDHPEPDHTSHFMICSGCDQVAELSDSALINDAIHRQASKSGFKVSGQTVEITGLCSTCQ